MIQKIGLLALAGALGTLARYGVSMIVHRAHATWFDAGTVVVNTLGCFLAGLLMALFESRLQVSADTRRLIFVGFMGAFTTFSALIVETGQLVRSSEWAQAAGVLLIQNGVGFAALFLGAALGRWS